VNITAPMLAAPTSTARVRLTWMNAPVNVVLTATSANFAVDPPFLRVTSPNGGETWTAGTTASIKWTNNLGGFESVRIDLSTDGGATYPTAILATTPSDNSQNVTVSSAWVSPAAKVRITWLKDGVTGDASDGTFLIR